LRKGGGVEDSRELAHRMRVAMRGLVSGSLALLLVVVGLSSACLGGGSEATPTRSAPQDKLGRSDDLHRPLDLPIVARGTPCPRTPGGRPNPDVGIALGSGPAYAVLGFEGNHVPPAPRAVVPLHSEDRKGSAYWHKTLWAVDPSYDGPILIRGGGIDPPRSLWFVVPSGTSRSQRRVRELHMPAERSKSWRYGPSLTVLPGSGCYALQADGTTFSEVIVFEARRSTT
jgi:hypothetical protein